MFNARTAHPLKEELQVLEFAHKYDQCFFSTTFVTIINPAIHSEVHFTSGWD
jgi:hypothetical protein